jgi:hypothetical protein
MIKLRNLTVAFGAIFVAGGLGYAAPASAQATRTWVSGVGDDLNPCSRTAPCKTFAGAISKTATHGEINCLDPGAFGAVTIGKAISIVCQYTEAGALATLGSNDITVNAPAGEAVYLSGLDLQGANTGLNGVRFIGGAALHIDNSIIRNFGAVNGQGVSFKPSGSSELYITNTVIAENGSGATGGGLLIQPTGAGGSARVVLTNVRFENNANDSLRIDTTGNSSGVATSVTIDDSLFAGSTNGINVIAPLGGTVIGVLMDNASVVNNSGSGIIANGANESIRVSNSVITGNATGLQVLNSGNLQTFNNNRLVSNPTVGVANNGAFTAPVPPS